nr:prepilin-type N-terminal cleavage/methylation domain-containing protein [uncultured Roseateles sp.]
MRVLTRAKPLSSPPRSRAAGFTLIELIIVITILGALAVLALPRLVDTDLWQLRAFGDDMQSQMQALLRRALTQRRPIVATITPAGLSFTYANGAAIATLGCPATSSPCIAEAGTRSITFNQANSGSSLTSTGAALTITVSSGTYTQAYRLEHETGLFYPLP